MHEMQLYGNEQFGDIRTMVRDGEPWFVAADVCRILEISNNRDALSRLDEDEKGVASTDTLGGRQDMTIINEAGLYALVLGSRKPEARAFKRWVTHEVLPAIRRYGAYVSNAALNDPEVVELLTETVRRMKEDNDRLKRKLAHAQRVKPEPEQNERGCRAFADAVREMVRSGEMRLISPYAQDAICPEQDVIGYIDSKYLYLLPRALMDKLEAEQERYVELFPLEARPLYKMLKRYGYIRLDSAGKSTRAKSIGGKLVRLLWMPRSKACGISREG